MGNDYSYGAAVLRPGTSLNGGYYVIESKIGEGGFGITYKAVQKKLNRTVCIKEYFLMGRCARDTQNNRVVPNPSDTALYNKYRDSFTKEAQTLGELHHPGIVEIIDVFDENGTSYMVMPFIEGESLQSIVERQGPLPHSLAINYMAQISDAVSYIHRRHILHRDIKPANIMITGDYKAVLIDFGSAREFEHDKTQAQTSLLTLGYAPLEQYTTTSRKGSYTDIYAMGATFYFILTGRVPLAAAARVTERMPEPSELNPQIPSSVNHAIMKAMELQSRDRYQSVEEFTHDLQVRGPAQPTTSGQTRLQSPRPTMTAPQPKRNKKWIVWMIVGIITLLVTVAAIALAIPRGNRTSVGRVPVVDSVIDSIPTISFDDAYADSAPDVIDRSGREDYYMKRDKQLALSQQNQHNQNNNSGTSNVGPADNLDNVFYNKIRSCTSRQIYYIYKSMVTKLMLTADAQFASFEHNDELYNSMKAEWSKEIIDCYNAQDKDKKNAIIKIVSRYIQAEAEPVEPEINPNVLYAGKRNKNNDSHTSNQSAAEGSPGFSTSNQGGAEGSSGSSYGTGGVGLSGNVKGFKVVSHPSINFISAERVNCTITLDVWLDKNGKVIRVEYRTSTYSNRQLTEKAIALAKRTIFAPLPGTDIGDELRKGTMTITFKNTP